MKKEKLVIPIIILWVLSLIIEPIAIVKYKESKQKSEELKVILIPNNYYIFIDNVLNKDSLVVIYPKFKVIKYDSCKSKECYPEEHIIYVLRNYENIYYFTDNDNKTVILLKDEVKKYIGYCNTDDTIPLKKKGRCGIIGCPGIK